MKFLTILTFASLSAHAANWSPETIFEIGTQFFNRQEASGKMDYMLNPIFCTSERDGRLSLIFSDDFRHRDEAYLIENGSVLRKVRTTSLRLERSPLVSQNQDFITETVVFGRNRLLCVSSAMQLESVPGGR